MIAKVIFIFVIFLSVVPNSYAKDYSKICLDKTKSMMGYRSCLEEIVREYEERLTDRNSESLKQAEAKEVGYRKNSDFKFESPLKLKFLEKQQISNNNFNTYLQSECDRQLYAIEGNGSAVKHLLCKIGLIEQRLKILSESLY